MPSPSSVNRAKRTHRHTDTQTHRHTHTHTQIIIFLLNLYIGTHVKLTILLTMQEYSLVYT